MKQYASSEFKFVSRDKKPHNSNKLQIFQIRRLKGLPRQLLYLTKTQSFSLVNKTNLNRLEYIHV